MDAINELECEKKRLQGEVVRLVKEKAAAQDRLEFVEELLGPTEAQRKGFQDQITAARAAALQACRNGAPIPVRVMGRLDENWLRSRGLLERDCALLQRGCLTRQDGVASDVSMLGDPSFRPYDVKTLEPEWEARGGLFRLSLGDIRTRWGEDVALEVVRCAIELDKHDASRRLGVELPWHEAEEREMEPAEVIALLERELCATHCCSTGGSTEVVITSNTDESSEAPSQSALEDASNSATWSFDSDAPPSDSGMFDTSSASVSPNSATSASLPREPADLNDEWSLADADIEQLLQPPCPRGHRGHRAQQKRAEMARSSCSSLEEESLDEDFSAYSTRFTEGPDDLGEQLGEVLRELLEEDSGEFGLFLDTPRTPLA